MLERIDEKIRKDLLEDLIGFLSINSVLTEYDKSNTEMPFGKGIKDTLLYLENLAIREGFVYKNVDNHAIHIEYGEGNDILGILAHLDVVPPGDGWKYDPFKATIEDGKLYARGVIDNKGPVIMIMYAMKILKESGFAPNMKIRLIVGCDEESGMRGIKRYFETEEMPKIAFTPDADFPVINGEKGIINFDIKGNYYGVIEEFNSGDRYNVVPEKASCKLKVDLKDKFEKFIVENQVKGGVTDSVYTIYGKSAHAAVPDEGVNAALELFRFLSKNLETDELVDFISNHFIDAINGENVSLYIEDDKMGKFTQNLGVVEVKDSEFKLGVNSRYPIKLTTANVEDTYKKLCDSNGYTFDVEYSEGPIFTPEDDNLVKTLFDVYVKHSNDKDNKPFSIGGGTYSKTVDKCVAFGPAFPWTPNVIHQPNEYMDINDMYKAFEIYVDAIYELTKE